MLQGAVFTELLNAFERIAAHCVAISGMVRRSFQDNPDYHVHSLQARELTDEEYQKLYDGFIDRYDVIRNAMQMAGMGNEAALGSGAPASD